MIAGTKLLRPTALLAFIVLAQCARPGTLDPANRVARSLPPLSATERADALRHARIFDDIDPRARDLLAGPDDEHAFAFDAVVACDFVEPTRDLVPGRGTTPKFFCALRHGPEARDIVKIKFGKDNGEVYGEILGSRLLWAIGVATDADYPVRIRCHHCPADPWISYRDFPTVDPSAREVREIDDAALQRLFAGAVLQEHPDQGWSLDELDSLLAPRAQVDALRLLAAFIAYGDDKPENQRLVCPFAAIDEHQHCRAPRLLFADLGSTFGRGANALGLIDRESRPTFAAWSTLPMWEDAAKCRTHCATRTSHENPMIGEAGRKLLADRLDALSEKQIRDLFTAARIERLGETTRDERGQARPVTADDWALAFEHRRAAISDARCPN